MLLRVVISSRDARRVQLPEIPTSVGQLISILKERLDIEHDFSLQFEDPEFGNALCSLTEISELPAERAVLHILWNCDLSPHNQSTTSVSSQDTISAHSEDFGPSWTDSIQTNSVQTKLRQVVEWPSPFPIPKFAHDVELKLGKANETYAKTKKGLEVTRDMKMEILDKIAQAIFDIKSYPEKDELESVAASLIHKYPCLKEPFGVTGYEGWKTSIKYKLGNYRSKLRQAGCNELTVNKKRKGEGEDGSQFTLKKPKRGEVNHVPDYPQYHDDSTLEEERVALIEEMMKKKKNTTLIKQKMELTFSLRRREVVECQPMVSEVQERWPALFSSEEISEEFKRITSKDLLGTFNESLDKFGPGLLKLYRSKKGAFGPMMEEHLDQLDNQTTEIVSHRKTTALRGLPIYLGEDTTKFFLKCVNQSGFKKVCKTGGYNRHSVIDASYWEKTADWTKMVSPGITGHKCLYKHFSTLEGANNSSDTETLAPVIEEVPVAILTVLYEDTSCVRDQAVILEGAIVLHKIADMSAAMAYLFGLLYALNIDYPKEMRYTFEAIQTIFFSLGGSRCSQRTRALKAKLVL